MVARPLTPDSLLHVNSAGPSRRNRSPPIRCQDSLTGALARNGAQVLLALLGGIAGVCGLLDDVQTFLKIFGGKPLPDNRLGVIMWWYPPPESTILHLDGLPGLSL
jgi:hypothetical protein